MFNLFGTINYLKVSGTVLLTVLLIKQQAISMEKIIKYTFKNGLVLIYKEVKPLPIIDIKLFIKVGTINETKEISGITNLTQTLLLKGTKTRTAKQISTEIESAGGSIGVDSSDDYSEISVAITNKHARKAFEIIADVFLNPVFEEQELLKEKMTVIASIKLRKDHIFDVSYDLLRENLYGEHPYSMLSIGTENSINKLTRNDLINWHKKYYGLPNVIIVVTGNIKFSEVKKYVKKYFEKIPSVSSSEIKLSKPEINTLKLIQQNTKFEQAYLMYGFLAPSVKNDDYIKLKCLNTYIGGGMSSLLFQELREKEGLGYEVNCFYPSTKDISRFVVYIGLNKTSIELAKEKINKIFDELKQGKINKDRLQDVKNYIKGVYINDHQTISKQGWYLGWWEIMNKGYEYDKKYLDDIEKVSCDDLTYISKKVISIPVIIQLYPEK